ncbi:MAG: DeoR/GlpR family DNA-binding transcription regulator [Clostridia bacterium]
MAEVTMKSVDRRAYVMRMLSEKPAVTVAELSKQFDISEVSVRKLLAAMERDGLIKRTWGGAASAFGSLRELSFNEKLPKNLEAKQAIAKVAYDCINDGEAIFLDNGTTTLELAKLIAVGPKRNIMICTNTINIAMELAKAEDIPVMIAGGQLRHSIMSCVGPMCTSALDQLVFDKCFTSCNRFSLEHGLSTPNIMEAEIKRKIIAVSKKSILLVDFSKYGVDALVVIAPVTGVDTIITDGKIPLPIAHQLRSMGVELMIGASGER